MNVAVEGVPDSLRDAIRSWGWSIVEARPDAWLQPSGDAIEIRVAATRHADDTVFPPFTREEFAFRIAAAKDRHTRLARRLHDLRSPLNAIHGYAEILAESSDGDALRFASNIRTASELLTSRLEAFREEGV